MRHTCQECDFDIQYLYGPCLHKGEYGGNGCPFFRNEKAKYRERVLGMRPRK